MPSSSHRRRRGQPSVTTADSDQTASTPKVRSSTMYFKTIGVPCLIVALLLAWYTKSSSLNSRRIDDILTVEKPPVKYYDYDVLEEMPHDPRCFTQGLEYDPYDGALLESCGWYKESRILRNGKEIYKFRASEFAEGITVAQKGKIHALTWMNKRAYIIDAVSGKELKSVEYPHVGWGLAYDADKKVLYSSDGSDTLYTLNVEDFKELSKCNVVVDIGDGKDRPVGRLNEMEWIDGILYVNIFMSVIPPSYPYYIVAINPTTCRVTEILNLRGIHHPTGDLFNFVMNGIAKSGKSGGGDTGVRELIVTGKRWDKMYRIALKEIDTHRRRPKTHNEHPITEFIDKGSF